MKSLQKLAKAQKGRFYTLYALAFALAFLIVLQAYLIVSVIDEIFLNNRPFDQVLMLLFLLLGVLIFRASLTYLTGKIGVKMATTVKRDYRKKLIQAYSRHSLPESYKGQSGQKVTAMLDTVDELDHFFSHYVPQRIITTVVPLIILLVIFTQNLNSGLIILVTAPFIPLFMIIIGRQTQKKSEEKLESLSVFSGRFLDTLQGLMSLKLYGRSKQYRKMIKESSLNFRDATMTILKVAFMSSLMLEFISMLSIGLVALELSLRLVVFESLDFFTAFFILLLVPEFFTALKELGSAFHSGRSSTGAASKLDEELAKSGEQVKWGRETAPTAPSEINLQRVGFQYGDSGFALKNVEADIPPFHQVAIVGKSGSGKSTLLNVIAGLLQPSEGELLVNGRYRSEYVEQEWFRQFSYITQHPYLFSGTVSDNIALGMEASKAEIEKAAQKAGIAGLIESLEHGYETEIGEGGRGLSGGEKQRIALARAFLKKPSIVLFDEPTTGLDLVTEQVLQESIRALAEDATIITVAHRLHTIKHSDLILFMDQGTIAAQGTHDELMKNIEAYRDLFLVQEEGQ
ncbi:thiol reductant ABC exporter subunit CydD [Desertibacillus haloalkaliphilus]|uniref:thiol reductant ABC exporter subunit CydD n=1 Tax=Desertibacillus haloalkaliphilus TaxID=1328930 RepID=UPI001C268D7D|nr:thiol reductant ABC exporter subunit CydD [Desertibacillus haloalkaliphilus]MBU8906436.1 thiol reductant ABC exporter subunit CydD [Desertibacillus haloalkaliphilus]